MVAICQLSTNWFGVLFSWTDTKKRSNLMLIVLEPDKISVPWVGDFRYLGSLPNENIIPGEFSPILQSDQWNEHKNMAKLPETRGC